MQEVEIKSKQKETELRRSPFFIYLKQKTATLFGVTVFFIVIKINVLESMTSHAR